MNDIEQEIDSYKLSKSNRIYFGVVAIITILLFIFYGSYTPYQFGRTTGAVLFYLLIPMFFGWLNWKMSKRKKNSGSGVFNFFLTLLIFGQMLQFVERLEKNKNMMEVERQRSKFIESLKTEEDPDKVNENYNNFINSMKTELDTLSQSSSGTEKMFFKVMEEFVNETQMIVNIWQESFDAVQEPRIFDFSVMNNKGEIVSQQGILNTYIKSSEDLLDNFNNMVSRVKIKLSKLDQNNRYVKGGIADIQLEYDKSAHVYIPLITNHIEYGNNMFSILELLQLNPHQWKYKNNELLFENLEIQSAYNEIFSKLEVNESMINQLTDELATVLST